MTGKLPPTQAITEAQKWAGTQDLMVFALEPLGMFPFHFVISEQGCISLVCVRHPKYPDFNTWYIEYSCRTIIAQPGPLPICCEGINREIWVRRTAQTWYRYLGTAEIHQIPGKIKRTREKMIGQWRGRAPTYPSVFIPHQAI